MCSNFEEIIMWFNLTKHLVFLIYRKDIHTWVWSMWFSISLLLILLRTCSCKGNLWVRSYPLHLPQVIDGSLFLIWCSCASLWVIKSGIMNYLVQPDIYLSSLRSSLGCICFRKESNGKYVNHLWFKRSTEDLCQRKGCPFLHFL